MKSTTTVFVPSEFEPNKVEPTADVSKDRANSAIDGAKLASDVSDAINAKMSAGFSVLAIVPITSGSWSYEEGQISGGGGITGGGSIYPVQGDFGYSMGWSFTSGVMIAFVKG